MARLARRGWVPEMCEDVVQGIAAEIARTDVDGIEVALLSAVADNAAIHERTCINLNPATNSRGNAQILLDLHQTA